MSDTEPPQEHPQPTPPKLQLTNDQLMRLIMDRPAEADILQALFEIKDRRSKSYFPNWDFVLCTMVLDQLEKTLTEDDPDLGAIAGNWKEALLATANSKGGFLVTNARDVLMKQDVQGMFMAPQNQPEKKPSLWQRLKGETPANE